VLSLYEDEISSGLVSSGAKIKHEFNAKIGIRKIIIIKDLMTFNLMFNSLFIF
jgi:hypothetical protein